MKIEIKIVVYIHWNNNNLRNMTSFEYNRFLILIKSYVLNLQFTDATSRWRYYYDW